MPVFRSGDDGSLRTHFKSDDHKKAMDAIGQEMFKQQIAKKKQTSSNSVVAHKLIERVAQRLFFVEDR
jgi:hypothetical protein